MVIKKENEKEEGTGAALYSSFVEKYDSYTNCPVCGNKMGCSSANRTVRTLAMLYVYRRMCWYCRGPLEPMRKDNIYCSNNCRRRAHYYKKQRKGNNEIQE